MTRRSGAGRRSECRRGSGAGSARRRAPRPRRRAPPVLRAGRTACRRRSRARPAPRRGESCGPPLAVSALQVSATATIREVIGVTGPRRPAGPPPPFHHSPTWPASQDARRRVAQRLAGVGDRVAGVGAALEGELGDPREVAALRAVEPEVQRQRVRVAARRRQRVAARRPAACARRASARVCGSTAISAKSASASTPSGRTSTAVTRRERDHHQRGGQRCPRTCAAAPRPGGRGTAGGRCAGPTPEVDEAHDDAGQQQPRQRVEAECGCDAGRGEQRGGGHGLPAVGGDVARLPGRTICLAGGSARRRDRDESTSSAGSGPSTASVISASGRPASKRRPLGQRDLVEVRDHRQGEQDQQQPGLVPAATPAPARPRRAPAPRRRSTVDRERDRGA